MKVDVHAMPEFVPVGRSLGGEEVAAAGDERGAEGAGQNPSTHGSSSLTAERIVSVSPFIARETNGSNETYDLSPGPPPHDAGRLRTGALW